MVYRRVVSLDYADLNLLTFRILAPYHSKDIALELSHIISH